MKIPIIRCNVSGKQPLDRKINKFKPREKILITIKHLRKNNSLAIFCAAYAKMSKSSKSPEYDGGAGKNCRSSTCESLMSMSTVEWIIGTVKTPLLSRFSIVL